ncbi:MAG: Uma2 family endonuclease [Acidobacteria bacterium]|nr:Uma2 family endonuclease [Acidobacteriota bacterium]
MPTGVTAATPTSDYARADALRPVPEFPGCRPIRITRDAIADHESRIEYWDAATETAWVACEPNTVYHEGPGQVLSGLLTRIAAIRGAPILTLGAADLLLRNAQGERQRILQADQVVFLDPVETRPRGAAVEVGSAHLPDVVLEVDYATDVRRGKLGLYEAWGFPEVWVEVPEGGSPRRRPGLTIHRRSADGYRSVEASVALPGWTAVEIHEAFNEAELSEGACAVLGRVGRALGEAEGTGPGDDLWLGAQRREARAEGCLDIVLAILRNRGLTVSERLAVRIADEDPDVLAAAALTCRDESDLLARLDRRPRANRRTRTRDR